MAMPPPPLMGGMAGIAVDPSTGWPERAAESEDLGLPLIAVGTTGILIHRGGG